MLVNQTKLVNVLGDKSSKALAKHLGLNSVGELLEYYPRRYALRGNLTAFESLSLGELVTVVGEVARVKLRRMKGKQGSILEAWLSDGESELTLAFFNQAWRQNDLIVGARGLFSGQIGNFSGKLQLAHPDYELFEEVDSNQAKAWSELPVPIYRAPRPLSTWKIQKALSIALEGETVSELLPAALLASEGLLSLSEAVELIHRPMSKIDIRRAQDSLKFHEAVVLHAQLAQQRELQSRAQSEKRASGDLLASFDASLPFDLTSGQKAVAEEIFSDLSGASPMHRLLQGEVGSGKTILALRAILAVAESRGQSALLAPTEVLATQHLQSITQLLGPAMTKKLGVRLLTGQITTQERKSVLLDLASGKCLLVIGTHALISDSTIFYDLGLIVVDEQHRFGVGQREKLRQKASLSPHVLTMTATPIPRTVAITVFGDLDVSTLQELPAGRQEIATHVVQVANSGLVSRIWQRVKEEVDSGRQVFVVCPRIDGKTTEEEPESEPDSLEEVNAVDPASAEEVFQALKLNAALAGLRIGLMHGRLSADERAYSMEALASGDLDILVSTTVIEVGVNVPNASVMVILDADRFGVSQLHQLRGRVGRGQHPGLCLLVTGADAGSPAIKRLDAVASTTDGFKLSEMDLELRGEGDVLGRMQSGGKSSLKLLRVIKDKELIERAKVIAEGLFREGLSPELQVLIEQEDATALKQS